MSDNTLDNLTVFHGELNPQLAHIYVRRHGSDTSGTLRLHGVVRGPRSCLTRTLPATTPLSDLGPGPDCLAHAVIPDPCFWGPGQPYLYDIDVELRSGDQVLAAARRVLGLRMFGVAGRKFYLEAKPWTFSGASELSVTTADGESWRRAGLVRYALAPSTALCEEMSEQGVLLVAEIPAVNGPSLAAEVRRLAVCASVGLIVLRDGQEVSAPLRSVAPNILFAEYFSSGQQVDPQPWADVAVCESGRNEDLPGRLAGCTLPVIVRRSTAAPVSLEEAGMRCRQLAEDLAKIGDFAGVLA